MWILFLEDSASRLVCGQSNMSFYVTLAASIDTPLSDLKMIVQGAKCDTMNYNATMVWLDIDYKRCGTVEVQEDEFLVRSNLVVVESLFKTDPAIIRPRFRTEFHINCRFHRYENASSGEAVVNITFVRKNITSLARFQISIDFYNGPSFNQIAPSPISLALGQRIFIAVKKHFLDENLKIMVKTCFASDSPTPGIHELQYLFLHNNCSIDTTYRIMKVTNSMFGFAIDAFLFIKIEKRVRYFTN